MNKIRNRIIYKNYKTIWELEFSRYVGSLVMLKVNCESLSDCVCLCLLLYLLCDCVVCSGCSGCVLYLLMFIIPFFQAHISEPFTNIMKCHAGCNDEGNVGGVAVHSLHKTSPTTLKPSKGIFNHHSCPTLAIVEMPLGISDVGGGLIRLH